MCKKNLDFLLYELCSGDIHEALVLLNELVVSIERVGLITESNLESKSKLIHDIKGACGLMGIFEWQMDLLHIEAEALEKNLPEKANALMLLFYNKVNDEVLRMTSEEI